MSLSIIQQAKDLLAMASNLSREHARDLWRRADPDVQKEAYRIRKEGFFTEENRQADRQEEHASPSGRYRLVIDKYTTGKGTWAYTRGRVYRDGELIADVKRNYSVFPFSWIEEHPVTGHDYLYCGADYQGQTFIDLSGGERRDTMSDGSDKGWGFCWAAHHPSPSRQYLVVEGCYWAAPYEVWAFDLTDPMHPKLLFRQDGDFIEWESDSSFRMANFRYDELNLPGHPLHGKSENVLSLEDLKTIPDDDEDIWVEKYDKERVVSLPADGNIEEAA